MPVWSSFLFLPETEYIIWNVTVLEIAYRCGSRTLQPSTCTAGSADKVQRWSSLGQEDFEERIGDCSWEVALVIPYSAFFMHNITSLDGKAIRANFYKCGDKLQTPHFLSWNPIDLEKPNFHCPEFWDVAFQVGTRGIIL